VTYVSFSTETKYTQARNEEEKVKEETEREMTSRNINKKLRKEMRYHALMALNDTPTWH